jgi:nicotinamide-nucleotide amidase
LAEHGINLYQKTTVGDNPERIRGALADALSRSDVVITSGGLGPTEDDITRESIAELLDRPLEFRDDLYADLVACFQRFRFTMSENNKKQAMAPRGAIGIENPHGTAPGLIVEDPRGTIICMPGVPSELKPMLLEKVIPYLRERFDIRGVIHYRVLKVCALGESRVDQAIGDLMRTLSNPTIGVLAYLDSVKIRIAAKADSIAEAERMIDEVDVQVRDRLPGLIMGINDDTIEEVCDRLLLERGWTLSVVETFTGGMLARRLTAAGAKAFAGGCVLSISEVPEGDEHLLQGWLLDKIKKNMLDYPSNCGVGLAALGEGRRGFAVFVSPEGECFWELNYWEATERAQIRASVVALEYMRRFMLDPRTA